MQTFINQLPHMLLQRAEHTHRPMTLNELIVLFNQQAILHLNISEDKMRFLVELLDDRRPGYIHDLQPILTRLLEEVSENSDSNHLKRSLERKGIIPRNINVLRNSDNEKFEAGDIIFVNDDICIRRTDNHRNAYMASRTMLIIALSTLYGNNNYAKYFAYEMEILDIYIRTYIQ